MIYETIMNNIKLFIKTIYSIIASEEEKIINKKEEGFIL
jgi:hypothetical protein